MNREVYHEGWLIKSPPTSRIQQIWRSRWRRRWFTLKQGDLPGQFFLEYYTDRNCRKLKGTIDLDECEQVDAGLRLDRRKQKFQNMFDVKTPRRTYYLAADSEEDMRGWVNCICQVCGLQDSTKQGDDRQYYNIVSLQTSNETTTTTATTTTTNLKDINLKSNNVSNETDVTDLNNTTMNNLHLDDQLDNLSIHNTYQNDDFVLRGLEYTNRETLVCDNKLKNNTNPFRVNNVENYSNFDTIAREANKGIVERSQSLKNTNVESAAAAAAINHCRTSSTGTIKKIPEKLKLNEKLSSGPYIPISECFSGKPLNNKTPPTPLNFLDQPRYIEAPRSHMNIGLNLTTTTEQPQYSPKRNNCQQNQTTIDRTSGRSSPTDSESVFTDDEWTSAELRQGGTLDRRLRPSDSSIENDSVGWSYVQRFSKITDDLVKSSSDDTICGPPPRPPKRNSALILDGVEKSKEIQSSDTENASPAIGPKDSSCCVEQSYDIPRSHRAPYASISSLNINNNNNNNSTSPTLLSKSEINASSTPNLVTDGTLTKNHLRPHCYTNAAPKQIEGNVFRYDFDEQVDAPVVDRTKKPKGEVGAAEVVVAVKTPKPPPNVNRNLKPTTPKFDTNSMRRRGGPISSTAVDDISDDDCGSFLDNSRERSFTMLSSSISQATLISSKSEDKLQYLDLDHSSSPQKSVFVMPASSTSTGPRHKRNASAISSTSLFSGGDASGTVYKTVDFLKTEAFKLIRQDAELNRTTNRLKD